MSSSIVWARLCLGFVKIKDVLITVSIKIATRNTHFDMIIRVYGKYIENFNGTRDGNNLNDFYNGNTKRDE